MCFCSCLKAKLNSSTQTNINSILTRILFDIPALPSCVSTVRLKVTVPMSCCPGILILAHSSTCPSLSLTVYVCLSNPTTTAVNHNNKKHNNMYIHLSCSQPINTELNSLNIFKVCGQVLIKVWGITKICFINIVTVNPVSC